MSRTYYHVIVMHDGALYRCMAVPGLRCGQGIRWKCGRCRRGVLDHLPVRGAVCAVCGATVADVRFEDDAPPVPFVGPMPLERQE